MVVKGKLKKESSDEDMCDHAIELADFGRVTKVITRKLIQKGMNFLGWCQTDAASVPGIKNDNVSPEQLKKCATVESQPDIQNLGLSNSKPREPLKPPALPAQSMSAGQIGDEINVNINAMEDKSRHGKRHANNHRHAKKSKLVVTRSFAKPKPGKKTGNSLNSKSKRSNNLKILKRRLDKLQVDINHISKSLDDKIESTVVSCDKKLCVNALLLATPNTRLGDYQAAGSKDVKTEDYKHVRIQKRQKLRTHRKTVQLIDIYEAGPNHRGVENHGKHPRCAKKVIKSKPTMTSPYLPLRWESNESQDWPSLPAAGERPKGLIKGKVKEIVINKQNTTLTKMTMKCWADIVNKDNPKITSIETSKKSTDLNRTWASVVSSKTVAQFKAVLTNAKSFKSLDTLEDKNPEDDGSDTLSENKKDDTSLDQHSCGDVRVLRRRIIEKGEILETKPQLKDSCCIDNMSFIYTKPVGNVIVLKESNTKTKKEVNKCNNRINTPYKNINLIQDMPRTRHLSGQKNKSAADLCDRLSLMSFNSVSDKCDRKCHHAQKNGQQINWSPNQKTSRMKKQTASTGLKDNQKTNQDEAEGNKQKKISLRYRALMRGENGRLDAKVITEVKARTRRNENLLVDKEANRNHQRKHRQQRQQTSHKMQRSPRRSPRNVLCLTSCSRDQPSTSKQTDKEINCSENSCLTKEDDRYIISVRAKCAYAESVPDLTRPHKKMCLDLEDEMIDMGWWHAYLLQDSLVTNNKTETSGAGVSCRSS